MNLLTTIQQTLISHIRGKSRQSTGGWVTFNCPACVKRGEPRPDTKMRGGLKFEGDTIVYHCFNCGFVAKFESGSVLSKSCVNLMRYMGVNDSDIKRMQLHSIREKEVSNGPLSFMSGKPNVVIIPKFDEIKLPSQSKPVWEWLEEASPPKKAIEAAQYLIDRGIYDHIEAYWSPHKENMANKFENRIIMPFWQDGKVVGYSARSMLPEPRSKYIMSTPHNYLYNIDKINGDARYLILVEGVLDAAAIDGVAVLTNTVTTEQADYLRKFQGEIILFPDRNAAGARLVNDATENGWSVSFPDWPPEIEDAADAVKKYGKLYTLESIINSKTSNIAKIKVTMKLK